MDEREFKLLAEMSDEEEKAALQLINDLGTATKEQIAKYVSPAHFSDFLIKYKDLIGNIRGDEWFLNADGKNFVSYINNIDNEVLRDYSEYDDEAEKHLEDDPLVFFLQVMNKMFKGSDKQKILQFASALSAPLGTRPLNDWGVGRSGVGKSAIKRRTLTCIPNNMWIKFNSMSDKRIFYTVLKNGSDYYKGKTLFFDEVDIGTEQLTLLRALTDPDMSEKYIVHQTLDMQSKEKILDLKIEKPITVWFTSVEAVKDDQLKNRFLLSNPQEDESIDRMVFEHQMYYEQRGIDPDKVNAPEADIVRRMVIKIVENTKNLLTLHPYDVEWVKITNRRLLPFFMTLVGIITRIYYKKRKILKNKYIVSTIDDLKIAAAIWEEIAGTTVYQVSEAALKLLPHIPDEPENAITRSELMSKLKGLGRYAIRYRTDNLADAGLINSKKIKNTWVYWKTDEGKAINSDNSLKHSVNEENVKAIIGNLSDEPIDKMIEYIKRSNTKLLDLLSKPLEERYDHNHRINMSAIDKIVNDVRIKTVDEYSSYCDGHHGYGIIKYEVTDKNGNIMRYCRKCGEKFENA